jgi:hypothetical protein
MAKLMAALHELGVQTDADANDTAHGGQDKPG